MADFGRPRTGEFSASIAGWIGRVNENALQSLGERRNERCLIRPVCRHTGARPCTRHPGDDPPDGVGSIAARSAPWPPYSSFTSLQSFVLHPTSTNQPMASFQWTRSRWSWYSWG
jgi:hypothetical protein